MSFLRQTDSMKKARDNLLHLVNKYMDLYQKHPDTLVYKAKAEKYAKIISKTIILSGMDAASFGQNAYFYDAAEGLLTATILLVAEFCEPKKRHIVSVFKIIQELLAPSQKKGRISFNNSWNYCQTITRRNGLLARHSIPQSSPWHRLCRQHCRG